MGRGLVPRGDGQRPFSPPLARNEPALIIGSAEFVDLPAWGIRRLRAKVDTGARSSALHVENIKEIDGGRVRFDVRLHRKKSDRRIHVIAHISRRGRVRSSSGQVELRLFVSTLLRMGPFEREVELSLVDREKMIYRMLLGRTALAHGFLVDPGRRYVLTHEVHGPKKASRSTDEPRAPKRRKARGGPPRRV